AAAARASLTKSFVRTIGISNPRSRSECEALWELAELDSGNSAVRDMVLESWLTDPELAGRALAFDASGLHAATGLSPARRAANQQRARKLIEELMAGAPL